MDARRFLTIHGILRSLSLARSILNSLVPNAPLLARLPLLTSIARVLEEVEANGENRKVGETILYYLIFMNRLQF